MTNSYQKVEVIKEINQVDINKQVNSVVVSSTGVQGPKGETGAAGANGTNGINGGNFTFEQQTPSASWSITHNLGYRPAVTVQDYGKIILEGELNHITANNLTIKFSEAISGYAYLS
jgi:hypothetical protein